MSTLKATPSQITNCQKNDAVTAFQIGLVYAGEIWGR